MVALFAEAFPERVDSRLSLAGEVVAGHYRLERLVGRGGYGVVYRAMDTVLERLVAIKFLPAPATVAGAARERLAHFKQEAQVLMDLSTRTTGIVQAHHVGVHRTRTLELLPYLVLEWLSGRTLEVWLREAQSAAATGIRGAFELLDGAAQALAVAHTLGVAHRDLKPANLFVVDDLVRGATIKVLDFGIAKVMASLDDSALQATCGVDRGGMTPRYGAPEQWSRAHGATGPWTDVFQMALLFIEILRGGVPALAGETPEELAHAAQDPVNRPSPRSLGLDVPAAVEEVFLRALAVPVRDRYPHMKAFWSALAAALPPPDAALPPPDAAPMISRRSGRSWIGAGMVGLAIGMALSCIVHMPDGSAAVLVEHTRAGELVCNDGEAAGDGNGRPACPEGQTMVAGACEPQCAAGETRRDGNCRRECQPPNVLVNEICKPRCDDGMILIAGTPPGGFHSATRARAPQVIPDLCVDRSEVTVASFKTTMPPAAFDRTRTLHGESGGRRFDRYCNARYDDRADHPINCVDLAAATEYCRRIGRRLPTEWEWEWTAGRGANMYPWGSKRPDCKRVVMSNPRDGCGADRTWPVGSKPAGDTTDGLHDKAGNVSEWTTSSVGDGRQVVRGGAWSLSDRNFFRVGHRDTFGPETRSYTLGFRCVVEAR